MENLEPRPPDAALDRICSAWPGRVWTWDGRNRCVACSFDAASQAEYQAAVLLVFPDRWDPESLAGASSSFRELVAGSGGLRTGQLAFSPKSLGQHHGYALWWPWNDGSTISVRVGVADAGADELTALRRKVGIRG